MSKEYKIWREGILYAISYLDENSWDTKNESTDYDTLYKYKKYPPKLVFKRAHEYLIKNNPEINVTNPGGGIPTNKVLQKYGFLVINKKVDINLFVNQYIDKYKKLIVESKKYSEIYKWEAFNNFSKNWDLKKDDLSSMIEKSFPGNNNLWTSNNYYPINMLKSFSSHFKDKTRVALINLFNESKNLETRIVQYRADMDELLKMHNSFKNEKNKQHYQDARTISLLLAFNNPKKHYLFKYNILKEFCGLLKIIPPTRGDVVNQLMLNNEVNDLIKNIIVKDEKLLNHHNKRLSEESFRDDDYNILTQDFIYSIVNYMNIKKHYYLVGAYWEDDNPQDQTDRFVKDNVWVNGYPDKFIDNVNKVPINSYIAIKTVDRKGNKMFIKAKGIVVANLNDGQNLEVKWEDNFKEFKVDFSGGYWDTISEVKNKNHVSAIWNSSNAEIKKEIVKTKNNKKRPLNQILYGPPGTGKTYQTINRALKIINEKEEQELDWDNRKIVKKLYNKRVKEGRIIFTTFHQSMSYEEFIEGIKPIEPKKSTDEIQYKVVDGILKKLCSKKFTLSIGDKIGNYKVINVSNEIIVLEKPNGFHVPFSINMLNKLNEYIEEEGIVNFDGKIDSKTIDKEKYPEFEPYIINGYPNIIPGLLEKIKKPAESDKPVVLIIDEINRGNISAIFGELITLIEEDKRLGEEEALTAILPYSKKAFGVPPNLYIIGTMNTADRSVEALDTALRRRFSFKEVMPDLEVLKGKEISGIKLDDLLDKINERIEVLLDRDHTIGHSYFLKAHKADNKDAKLKEVFKDNIIPLLQEYFFGDYSKIGLILGKEFVNMKDQNSNKIFADFDTRGEIDLDKKYSLKPFKDIDFIKAIQSILKDA